MDSSTHLPPYKRLFKTNKALSLRERTGHFGSLLSIFPVDTSVQIDHSVRILKAGGLVGMPTETVYGIAASIDNESALQSVFRVKERPFFDPLIVHISEIKMIEQVTRYWSPFCHKLAEEFWPGPLTLVIEKNPHLNPLITSGLNTVAIRMPAHPVALAMISRLGTPVAAPSANKFGKTSPTSRRHVVESFPNLFTLEGGECEIGLESTVVSVGEDNVTILRPGFITLEDLRSVVPNVDIKSSAHSPGHLENHYQPEKPLILVQNERANLRICLRDLNLKDDAEGFLIELADDPYVSARSLYQKLREGSASNADYLICYWRPEWEGGLWQAIGDRLKKASSVVC